MDRRQRKTREAIFRSFTALLAAKDFNHITVEEIIKGADIGRATFYAHFETKDYLLKAFCEELFCHIFDAEQDGECDHRHIFECASADSAFLHLFKHLQKNDHNILSLLSSKNNELFLQYFRCGLEGLVRRHLPLFASRRAEQLPDAFWEAHIVATFVATLKWWVTNGMKESPEKITEYFFAVI